MEGRSTSSEPYFDMGPHTFRIPMTLFAENRQRLAAAMKDAGHSGIILLKGGEQETRHDTDHENIFRQESYFHWCFGVLEAGCYGAVDIETGAATLFMPRLPPAYSIWMGKIWPVDKFQARYAVEHCQYVDEIPAFAEAYKGKTVHVLYGMNSDSGNFAAPADFKGMESYTVDKSALFPVIADLRVYKTEAELRVMRYVSEVTSAAHVEVMRQAQPGWYEYQLEALFKFHIYNYGGCRHEAYTCICACGPSGATLHYGHAGAPNDKVLKEDAIGLLDMGAEYNCYCSDITCSYPMSGKFSPDQRAVYEGVLRAVKAVEDQLKPGVSWLAMHRTALVEVTKTLIEMGVLKGDVDALIESGVSARFMPCGLGHFIGLDTHDVGGYLPGHPERAAEFGFRNLRTARTLGENMVLTVEPGIYFIESQVDEILAKPEWQEFIASRERLEQLKSFGGVRIEDVVLITKDGFENFTQTPRTIDEIEAVMAGGPWPPQEDTAPELRRTWGKWGALKESE
eukprot:m.115923 g.115923  ORF g.115923 m.115923 type:complete len:511 (-) comp15508_c0_seq3:74-1606(-)